MTRRASARRLPGLPRGIEPYDWALKQLRISRAHKITRGSKDVVVAVIDLGYRDHPDLRKHLWVNPDPKSPARHGWDCHDDDASLEDNYYHPPTEYSMGHHAFVVGEVAACAPRCPIMAVRVGFGNRDSWWRGIEWAVEHGARILVMPHGIMTQTSETGPLTFERGLDFTYPEDEPRVRPALEAAHAAGCLVVRGAADNRGRRVTTALAAIESVMAIGSSNRAGRPADICADTDCVEAGAPGGERHSGDERDWIWGCGGERNYIPFTGGCMASGFGGGVAALAWSRFPWLTNEQVRQVLRNTARGEGWTSKLGYGILDAAKVCGLRAAQLAQRLDVKRGSARRPNRKRLTVTVVNRGVFDVEQAMLVIYNGDPRKPPSRTYAELITCQLGHTVAPVRGLSERAFDVDLSLDSACPGVFDNAAAFPAIGDPLWYQLYTLDRHGSTEVKAGRI